MTNEGTADNPLQTSDVISDPVSAITADAGQGAIRDRLRKIRSERQAKTTTVLLVGGYNRALGVRYRALPQEEIAEIAQKMQSESERGTAAIDLVAKCCEAIMVRENPEDSKLQVLVDDEDQPVRFDIRLAEYFGIEATSAREIVREIFSPGGASDLAAADHAGTLLNWMTGRDGAIARDLLGE